MPIFETSNGRRIDLRLPPTEWPEMQKAKENYERLKAEQRAAQQRLGSLRRKREQAVEADRIALAKALKEGADEPTEAKVDQIDKELLARNRRLEALERALDDAEADVLAVVDEHRDEWLEEVSATVDAAYEKYAEAVEAFAAVTDSVYSAWALWRWVKFFPDEEMSYRVRAGHVAGLMTPSGDPYTTSQVLDALRQDAVRPAPREEVEAGPTWLARGF